VQGYLLLLATVNGFTVDETGIADGAVPAAPRPVTWPPAAGRGHGPRLRRLAPGRALPTMTSLADEFALADPDERFEILLDIFVDGLARRAATQARRDNPNL